MSHLTREQENTCHALATLFDSVKVLSRADILAAAPVIVHGCEQRDQYIDEPAVVAVFTIDPDGTLKQESGE